MADRLVGKRASLLINSSGWNYVADLYDWNLEVETVTFEASIKGEVAERHVPSHIRGRLTARRYVQSVAALANNVITAAVNGTRLDWAIVGVDTIPPTPANFSGNAAIKAQGTGYVTRGTIAAPRGAITDDWEMTLDTVPTIT